MEYLKKLGLLLAVALAATCGVVGSASATSVDPAGTPYTLTATNNTFTVGSLVFICPDSTITGTTPASASTSVSLSITTLTYSACTYTGMPMTVKPTEGCQTPASSPKLDVTSFATFAAVVRLTLPATCNIHITIASIGCDMTVTGGQTLGNGTLGTGGIIWTNRTPMSMMDLATVDFSGVDATAGGCSGLSGTTGTWTANYLPVIPRNLTVTTP
jgi:hypothetical protein